MMTTTAVMTWRSKTSTASSPSASIERSADLAELALPEPGRIADRLLEREVLQGQAGEPACAQGTTDTGLQLRRVNGHFNREDRKNGLRTNRVEAEAIVAEITSIVRSGAGKSIGVVTFNRQQQELILDLFEETGDQQIAYLLRPDTDDGIFVKNLENVQGDERDIILVSTAFSKRPGERNMPELRTAHPRGREKRLNVAVTRARAKVIVFCSFDPVDIDLSQTRSVGMAHLKAYLESAARASGDQSVTTAATSMVYRGKFRSRSRRAARSWSGGRARLRVIGFRRGIAVREPGSPGWQVAIMLDGPGWARRGHRGRPRTDPRSARVQHRMAVVRPDLAAGMDQQ